MPETVSVDRSPTGRFTSRISEEHSLFVQNESVLRRFLSARHHKGLLATSADCAYPIPAGWDKVDTSVS